MNNGLTGHSGNTKVCLLYSRQVKPIQSNLKQNQMTYVIVKNRKTIIGKPLTSYKAALNEANRLFGDDVMDWMNLNLRVEEARP